MQFVLTLTVTPNTELLTSGVINRARDTLIAAGASNCQIRWLAPRDAVDISFEELSKNAASQAIDNALMDIPIDKNIQESTNRRKQLLIADMDSTILQNETLDDIGTFFGINEEMAGITDQAMRGEIDFELALRQRVRLLTGKPLDLITQILVDKIQITAGAETLIKTMGAHGAKTGLVSGGLISVTEMVKMKLGFDFNYGNTLTTSNNIITGGLDEPIIDSEAKSDLLQKESEKLNLTASDVLAVGDGANDIPMIKSAGMGVAFRAKPTVKAIAPFRINHGDLTALLYLQGYSKEEFVI
ncbi:MAG: phosphoserine phosphatase SerB [Rhodospirillaceae bacterium]|nr:phosphoserine phosphatase SerB [Rhodospirillaceae bacterium]|tara:strand:- start:1059 stop:1958 length:900 start_codon:yes stop_codon:yes gene_type:complete